MNAQEALEIIANAIQTDKMTVEQDEALAIAQEALKKRIPKKVVFGYDEQDDILCPVCEFPLAYVDDHAYESSFYNYCPLCSQRLGWSDTK